jgi:hypothetical protein
LDTTTILADIQALQAEINAMCQASVGATDGAPPLGGAAPVGTNNIGGGVV